MPLSIVLHYFHPPSPPSVGGEPLPDSVALWFGWKGLVLSLSLFLSVWHRCSVGPLRLQQTHKHAHTAPFAREVPCGPWSQTFSGGDFRRERLHPKGSWEHKLACSFWRSCWGKGGFLSSRSFSIVLAHSFLSLSVHSWLFWAADHLVLITALPLLLTWAMGWWSPLSPFALISSHLLYCISPYPFLYFLISSPSLSTVSLFSSLNLISSYFFCFYLSFNLVSSVLYFFLNCFFLICLNSAQLSSSIFCACLVNSHLYFNH